MPNGSFRLRRRGPHRRRNPRTGDRVEVSSKHVARFRPGKELKELIDRELSQPVPPPLTQQPEGEKVVGDRTPS